jgi:DNA polymerase-3 subunit delta
LARVASELKPVYLIAGSDRPKVMRALRRLRARVGDDALAFLNANEAGADDAVSACNALGLFAGEARLVVVEDVGRWKAADAKAIAAYVGNPAPATVLALVADTVKRDSPLVKACAKAGDVLIYDAPRKRELPTWVGEQFARFGATADADACRALVELVGEDLVALEAEIEKLSTWAGGEPVGRRDVERLVVPQAEASIFELTDAWGRRDVGAVLAAAEALLERSPRELPRLVGLLAGHVGRVRACQALAAEGVRPRDAAARLKIHPFAAEKAFAHAANYGVDELRSAIVRIAELDLATKGGSRLSGELELVRALVEITRPRAAAAA